jgi:gluconate 5-dehydrogenase
MMNNILNLFSLAGKTALVTGSARGIGKAVAGGFAAAGARLYLLDRLEAQGQAAAQAIGGRFIKANLARLEEIEQAVEDISSREAQLDVLVNNAAIELIAPLEQLEPETLEQVWQVNLRAAVALTRGLLPLLKKSAGASIINVTSIHETIPYHGNIAYCMSKAALSMFTKTVSLEVAPYGIRVNSLAPGAVETELNREVLDKIGRDNFAGWIPLGRVARTEEMVGPALFLASPASSYMTGTTLFVDGGYMQNLVRYRPLDDEAARP